MIIPAVDHCSQLELHNQITQMLILIRHGPLFQTNLRTMATIAFIHEQIHQKVEATPLKIGTEREIGILCKCLVNLCQSVANSNTEKGAQKVNTQFGRAG